MDKKCPTGHIDPMQMRRIGTRHVVVLPPRQATIVNVDELRKQLSRIDTQIAGLNTQREQLEAKRADLGRVIAQFDVLSIDRHDDDPEVDPAQPPAPAAAESDDQ